MVTTPLDKSTDKPNKNLLFDVIILVKGFSAAESHVPYTS